MTPDDVMRDLEDLRVLQPDPARAARTRARCHAQLVRRQEREVRETPREGFGRRVLVPVGVLTMCFLYVVSLVRLALHLRANF